MHSPSNIPILVLVLRPYLNISNSRKLPEYNTKYLSLTLCVRSSSIQNLLYFTPKFICEKEILYMPTYIHTYSWQDLALWETLSKACHPSCTLIRSVLMCSPQNEYCNPPTKWKKSYFCLFCNCLHVFSNSFLGSSKLHHTVALSLEHNVVIHQRLKRNGANFTSLPSFTPTSCATRAATDMAATRRGWVQPIFKPPLLYPCQTKTHLMNKQKHSRF